MAKEMEAVLGASSLLQQQVSNSRKNKERVSMRPLTRNEVRQIDDWAIEELGLPGIILMENAGRVQGNPIALEIDAVFS